jgi:hypothetical protein
VGVVVEMLFFSMLFALKGRRWGGRIKIAFNAVKGVFYQGSIYDAEPTFTSYGVAHGDRAGLLAAMPESHREFLRNLVWVHEQVCFLSLTIFL